MPTIVVDPNPMKAGQEATISVPGAPGAVEITIENGSGGTPHKVTVPKGGSRPWTPPDSWTEAWLSAPGVTQLYVSIESALGAETGG